MSISAGTLSTRKRGNNPSFNHIQVDADEVIITMIEFTGEEYVRAEKFRKNRRELSAWRRNGYRAMRKDAAVLDTQA